MHVDKIQNCENCINFIKYAELLCVFGPKCCLDRFIFSLQHKICWASAVAHDIWHKSTPRSSQFSHQPCHSLFTTEMRWCLGIKVVGGNVVSGGYLAGYTNTHMFFKLKWKSGLVSSVSLNHISECQKKCKVRISYLALTSFSGTVLCVTPYLTAILTVGQSECLQSFANVIRRSYNTHAHTHTQRNVSGPRHSLPHRLTWPLFRDTCKLLLPFCLTLSSSLSAFLWFF